jgi:pimeloyl-ACP methyl ester carboxylesterase
VESGARTPATFVLVPGFWLGSWAWEEVESALRDAGHEVEALTLPGLGAADAPRRGIRLADHVRAVAGAVAGAGRPVVLVVHSGAGAIASGVADRLPEGLRRIVYVDSGPLADGMAINPDLAPDLDEIPLPSWADLEAGGSSLEGLDEARLAEFRRQAVPHPAGPARDRIRLINPERHRVPVTMITCTMRSIDVARMAKEGHPFFGELSRQQVDYVDLPTGHWPMWSRPADLATALAAQA